MTRHLITIVLHLALAVIYVSLAQEGWRDYSDPSPVVGEPFLWVKALPVLMVLLVWDTIWAFIIIRNPNKDRRVFATCALITLVAMVVDFSHH